MHTSITIQLVGLILVGITTPTEQKFCENEWDKLDGTNEDKLLSEITLGIEAIKAKFPRILFYVLN